MQTPNPETKAAAEILEEADIALPASKDAGETATSNAPGTSASTLIEFPGAGRNRPAWRKELSERVREIQQRRARESALETGAVTTDSASFEESPAHSADPNRKASRKAADANAKQLGLVPPLPDSPELNPIVVAALQRIERARQHSMPSSPMPRSTSGRTAATAAARVTEEQFEPVSEPTSKPLQAVSNPEALTIQEPAQTRTSTTEARVNHVETTPEPVRASSLVAVPSKQGAKSEPRAEAVTKEATPSNVPAKLSSSIEPATMSPQETTIPTQTTGTAAATDASTKPQPRRIEGVIDDSWLTRLDAEILPKVASAKDVYDDRAPRTTRFFAGLTDLIFVAFLSAPFGAAIELTIGNWSDSRVFGSMCGIVAVVMFLYLTCSTALAGRTLGMKLFSLHTVDAKTALAPKTGQCVRRTLIYMLSLATGGIGILYALFDAEGRTAHDVLSSTVIVKS